MNNQDASTPPSDNRRAGGAARAAIVAAAVVALAGSLWAALGTADCGNCHPFGQTATANALAWAGIAFYAILLAATVLRGPSPWTPPAFLAAAGVHIVLLALLAHERHFCPPCVLTGTAALLGALASLATRPRAARWAIAPLLAGALLASAWVAAMQPRQPAHPLPQSIAAIQPASTESSRVTLVLYEREGCKHCLDFEENILPEVTKALGGNFDVDRQPAAILIWNRRPSSCRAGRSRNSTASRTPRRWKTRSARRSDHWRARGMAKENQSCGNCLAGAGGN